MEVLKTRVLSYLNSMKEVLGQIKLSVSKVELEDVVKVAKLAEDYYKDSLYYLEKEDLVTSLVCIVYSEGLLDTLRMLNLAYFKWPFEK